MFMADKYEKRHYMKDYDGFDGGWSMCDTQYETFCVWVGEGNPAFITFSEVIDAYNDDLEQYNDYTVANIDNENITIPSKILHDIAESEYYWEINS